MTATLRTLFWTALAVTLIFAWTPHPPTLISNDKVEHTIAFLCLTLLIRFGYPERDWRAVGLALAALGAIIEVVQAIPALHRDCDIYDWYADILTIALGMTIAAAVRIWVKLGSVPMGPE